MAPVHTHYDNLKVARDAPPEVIRAAYKSLCQKYHPDRHGNSAEAIRVIQIINTAYAVLSDPAKRREHDEWIARSEAQTTGKPATGGIGFTPRHSHRRTSRRSRKRSPFDFLQLGHGSSAGLARAIHKTRSLLEQLTRKFFRKT